MKKKIAVLSWHPASSAFLISGGYKRFYEIAKRCPYELIVIDRFPSIYKTLATKDIRVMEYGRHLTVKFLLRTHPYIYKAADRLLTVFAILLILFKNRDDIDVIYVPYSELPELTAPAILAKFIFRIKVILCNLNVNTFFLDR